MGHPARRHLGRLGDGTQERGLSFIPKRTFTCDADRRANGEGIPNRRCGQYSLGRLIDLWFVPLKIPVAMKAYPWVLAVAALSRTLTARFPWFNILTTGRILIGRSCASSFETTTSIHGFRSGHRPRRP